MTCESFYGDKRTRDNSISRTNVTGAESRELTLGNYHVRSCLHAQPNEYIDLRMQS